MGTHARLRRSSPRRIKPSLHWAIEAVSEHRRRRKRRGDTQRPDAPANGRRPGRLAKGVERAKPDDPGHFVGQEHGEGHETELLDQARRPRHGQGSGGPDHEGEQEKGDQGEIGHGLGRDQTRERCEPDPRRTDWRDPDARAQDRGRDTQQKQGQRPDESVTERKPVERFAQPRTARPIRRQEQVPSGNGPAEA